MNVHERQKFLERTTGAFEEEAYTYSFILVLVLSYPFVLILATFLQYLTYHLYNKTFHPFRDLVKNEDLFQSKADEYPCKLKDFKKLSLKDC